MEAARIIRKREVLRRTGYADYSSIWRLERNGEFPKRVQLNANGAVGWYEAEIDEWVRNRVRAGGRRPVRRAAPTPASPAPTPAPVVTPRTHRVRLYGPDNPRPRVRLND
jgi:prophage regulatory protein